VLLLSGQRLTAIEQAAEQRRLDCPHVMLPFGHGGCVSDNDTSRTQLRQRYARPSVLARSLNRDYEIIHPGAEVLVHPDHRDGDARALIAAWISDVRGQTVHPRSAGATVSR